MTTIQTIIVIVAIAIIALIILKAIEKWSRKNERPMMYVDYDDVVKDIVNSQYDP